MSNMLKQLIFLPTINILDKLFRSERKLKWYVPSYNIFLRKER